MAALFFRYRPLPQNNEKAMTPRSLLESLSTAGQDGEIVDRLARHLQGGSHRLVQRDPLPGCPRGRELTFAQAVRQRVQKGCMFGTIGLRVLRPHVSAQAI